MSRPSVPAFDTGPIGTPRRSLPRRIARIAVRVFGGLVVLVVIALAFLHTPWGKSMVRGLVEKRLAAKVNGTVTVGSLDYGFMFGEISIGNVEIRNAANESALKIASIDLALDRGALLGKEIVLDELTIAGLDVSSPAIKGLFKKSNSKPLGHVQIKKLAVTGQATITKPDGSIIAIREIGIAGAVDARPAARTLDVALARLAAKVDVRDKHIDVALDGITVKRANGALDVAIAKIAAGALGIDALTAHIERGAQHAIKLGKVRVDSDELATLIKRRVLLDDVTMDLAITGPESAIAIAGTIKTRDTSLVIDGKVDVASAIPRYELTLVGEGKSTDVTAKKLPAVGSSIRVAITGSGKTRETLDAKLTLDVGATTVNTIAIDSVHATAHALHGAYTLEGFRAKGVGFDIVADGSLSADRTLAAKIGITGSPAKAMTVLAAAGIKIPPRVPRIGKVDLAITAAGKLDGEVGVQIAPTQIAIAGGTVGITGDATLDNKKLRVAHAKMTLGKLDLAGLSRLAGRPPKVRGSISGTLAVTKTPAARDVAFDVAIALADKPLVIAAKGTAGLTSATAHAQVRRTTDRAVIAKLDATLPLDAKGFQPNGPWKVSLDVTKRELGELATLLPGKQLPAGDVAVHAELAGSPARPTGTIQIAAHTKQDIALTATLIPTKTGLSVKTTGSVALAGDTALANINGTITMPYRWIGKKPDVKALRAGLVVDATIDIPERSLASLQALRPKLAQLDGNVGGRITIKGAAKTPAIDARLAWRGYTTAAGAPGETLLVATGSPTKLQATIDHAGLKITADVDRATKDRVAIHAKLRAARAPLLSLVPAFAAKRLAMVEPGTLDWNMDADVVLVSRKVDQLAVTGTLDLQGASVKIPNSKRRYHDIALAVAAEPAGIRLKSLTLHEDQRTLAVSGLLALDKTKPQRLDLALASRDWLVFGGEKFGMADAPRATATFDIGVTADLTKPILDVDATVHSLALRSPDRLERGHYFENAGQGGDIIYVTDKSAVGKLPYVAVAAPAPKKRRAMNIRVHIPKPIRVEQTPMDLMAKGELAVTVRDEGVQTRGVLTMTGGKLNLFGRDHALTGGTVTFSDEHPKGHMALEFERILPKYAKRDLSTAAGNARITMTGSPTKPKVTLAGAANAAMMEVMAMYNAGRPLNVARPGLPASPTVQAPRGDQLFMLTFMASNLPHLLFLDRVNAWADPYEGRYGAITNVEAERYSGKTRVRAVVRPTTPGRSNAEMQYDRLLINNDRSAVGVGVRAGDRLGGGLGLFFEWSSRD